jgi:hypothetical protein
MRDPSDYAGKTVRLRPDAAELGGQQAEVVDWYERLGDGVSWRDNPGDPRAENYRLRHALGGLPDDDDVLFARVDGMGQLIHLTEIEGYIAPTPGPGGPAQPNPGRSARCARDATGRSSARTWSRRSRSAPAQTR